MHGGAYTMKLEGLQEVTQIIGSDGVELMPINSPLPGIESLYDELKTLSPERVAKFGGLIATLHQSFLGQAQEQPDPRLAIPSERLKIPQQESLLQTKLAAKVMPGGEQSLFELADIARLLGRESTMTCVVFANQQGIAEFDRAQADLFPAGALIQPTPDVLACWNIDPSKAAKPQRLIEELLKRRYYVAFGTFHKFRKGKVVDFRIGEDLPLPEDAVAEYQQGLLDARMIKEVHIELNRNDFGTVDPDWSKFSQLEAIALMRGTKLLRSLPLGRRLEQLRSANWMGPVVVEFSLAGVIDALKAQGARTIKRKDVLQAHADINGNLREELPFLKSNLQPLQSV